jgi:hypothetical protein
MVTRSAPQFPPDVQEKLVTALVENMKAKLAAPVEDTILRDIITSNMQITWEHIQSIPVN